ncbi:hypothetical protein BASA62_004030 [Batrachochytrium salamandrivorans]|nr:hypothetical protein BASA62_004030 [Batrachochytrium salamandrivorans]
MSQSRLSTKDKQSSRHGRHSDTSHHGSASSISQGNPDINADTLFKMSKKIAQLTKVIYYLNTKNEDHSVEMQNLVDSYEAEITEVIEEGTGVINDIRLKWIECDLKVKSQDDMITTYLETVKAQKEELKLIRESETKLRADLVSAESTRPNSSSDADANTAEVRLKEADKINQELEAKILDVTSNYEQKIRATILKWSTEVEDLKGENSKKLRSINEEKQKSDDFLRGIIETAKIKENSDSDKHLSDIQHLKQLLENQEKESNKKFLMLDTELRLEIDREHRLVMSQDAIVNELQSKVVKKDSCIHELENDVRNLKTSLDDTNQMMLSALSEKEEQIERNKSLDQRAKNLDILLSEATMKLNSQEKQIKEKETAFLEAQVYLKEKAEEILNISNSLKEANNNIQTSTEKILNLEEIIQNLNVDIAQRDARFEKTQEELSVLEKKRVNDIEEALCNLTLTLKKEKEEEIHILVSRMEKEKNDIFEQHTALIEMQREFDVRRKQEYDQFEQDKASMNSKLKNIENALTSTESDLKTVTFKFDLQSKEMLRCEATIQSMELTLQNLEVEKSNLLQKLIHVDRQARSEMAERFQKEKCDLETLWHDQHHIDTQNFKDILTRQHAQELEIAVHKLKVYYMDEADVIKMANKEKIEGFLAEMSEKENEITQQRQKIKDLEEKIEFFRQENIKDLERATADGIDQIEKTNQKWREEIVLKETQFQMELTLSISNQEKRHGLIVEELDTSHKKQLDDLRSFHTSSAIASKKEADVQRQLEIAHMKTIQADQTASLILEQTQKISKLELELGIEKKMELDRISEEYNAIIAERDSSLQLLLLDISKKQEKIDSLFSHSENLESKLMELHNSLTDTVSHMEKQDIENKRVLEDNRNMFDAHLKNEIELVKTEHLREMQLMLQNFEKAKSFLKKQIFTQATQLQEAETKYINREPRDVDVLTISDLKKNIDEHKSKIASQLVELDHFRREMNNREENFNRIFNKSPIVGVIQPMKPPSKKFKSKPELFKSNHKLPPLALASRNRSSSTDLTAACV